MFQSADGVWPIVVCVSLAAFLVEVNASASKQGTICAPAPDIPAASCLLQGLGETKKTVMKLSNSGVQAHDTAQVSQVQRNSTDSLEGVKKGRVSYLFTFGGPGTLTFPLMDKTQPDQCFPGIRFYRTEDNGMYQDITAEFSPFVHPQMNTLVLGEDLTSSTFHGCPEENFGQPQFPSRWEGLPSVSLHTGTTIIHHARRVYDNWKPGANLTGVLPSREREVKDLLHLGLSAGGLVSDLLSWFPVGNVAKEGFTLLKEGIQKGGHTGSVDGVGLGSDWRLVGAHILKDPNFSEDWDWVALVQHVSTLDCILTFDSADLAWPYHEQRLGLRLTKEDFCGCKQCAHAGFRQELRATVSNPEYQASIPLKLQSCNNVAVTGYSMGGATADLFSYCANSGPTDDPDYKLISWTKGTPTLMKELAEEDFLGQKKE